MKNGQSRETGNIGYTRHKTKTKKHTQHNMCWTRPFTRHKTTTTNIICVGHDHSQDTRRRQPTQYVLDTTIHKTQDDDNQHNMCWTRPFTRHKTTTTNIICVGHDHSQDTRRRQPTQYVLDTTIHKTQDDDNQHNMCWTRPFTRHKTTTTNIICVGHDHSQDTRRRQPT